MPTPRFFALLGLVAVVFIAGATVKALYPIGLITEAALCAALWFDHRRARTTAIRARRRWPAMLVQGVAAELRLELESSEPRSVKITVREGLHPGLADQPPRRAFTIPTEGRAEWTFEITPRRRGTLEILPVTARIRGPLGLALAQRDLVAAELRNIYPQIRWAGKLGRLLQLAQRRQLGSVRTRLRGTGDEPYGLREYLVGDPQRAIHWKATARHGRPIVREDVVKHSGRLVILLDCGRAMTSTDNGRSKLDHALASSLAVARIAAARGDRVALVAFDSRVRRVTRVRGGGRGIGGAYRALFDVEATLVEPAYDIACSAVTSLERRSSTVMVFTSVVDLAAAELLTGALNGLSRRHHPLLVNLEDAELGRLARGRPTIAAEVFAKVASLQILLANRRLARNLRRRGVWTVSATADRLALEATEAYLAMAQRR